MTCSWRFASFVFGWKAVVVVFAILHVSSIFLNSYIFSSCLNLGFP